MAILFLWNSFENRLSEHRRKP